MLAKQFHQLRYKIFGNVMAHAVNELELGIFNGFCYSTAV